MKYLLDTNICIYLIKKKPEAVLERLDRCRTGDVGISSVTHAELAYGVEKSSKPEQNNAALEEFLLPFEIASFGSDEARVYGKIRAYLEGKGTPIGSLDTMIAAHALALGITLVTNNTREFSRVQGLRVEDWTKPE